MPEEQDGVIQDSPPETNEQVVNQDASVTDQQEQTVDEPSQEVQTPSDVGQPSVNEDVDEMGVPWKNRAMEYQRKLESNEKKTEEILKTLEAIKQGQQPRTYSEAEYRAFANHPDTPPEHKAWAERQIEKLRDEKVSRAVENAITKYTEKQRAEMVKQQSLRIVQTRYPDAFVQDANGNIVGWNNKSPLTQRIYQYMQDPEVAKNPRGLLVAASLAYSDISLGQNRAAQTKNMQLKQQVKNLQKKTLVESGVQTPVKTQTDLQKAVKQTENGDIKSATNAMKEILRARGAIE